jgi:hypothetical protein
MKSTTEERLVALEARVLALEGKTMLSAHARSKENQGGSPREFLLAKVPRTDSDRTLTAGYYIEVISGKDSFNFDDVEDFYAQAKEAAPANRRDPPYQNVKKGYFREVGKRQTGMHARNRWALTNSGIARVDGGFGSGGRR